MANEEQNDSTGLLAELIGVCRICEKVISDHLDGIPNPASDTLLNLRAARALARYAVAKAQDTKDTKSLK